MKKLVRQPRTNLLFFFTMAFFFTRQTLCILRRNVIYPHYCRMLTVLAIETSCDDTSVALLHSPTPHTATLLAHKTVTSPNRIYGGIHPLISVTSHCENLATLISSVLSQHRSRPDLVAVTRGPGVPTALGVGLDTAKGLALAWGVPLVAVNHMLAHALTPRLVCALGEGGGGWGPEFPFLTVLVSGGHTMVVRSAGLTSHSVLVETTDMALGDVVDKCARTILPAEVLESEGESVVYGAVLEEFCFGAVREGGGYGYHVEGSDGRKLQYQMMADKWGDWKLSVPLVKSGLDRRRMCFSFSGLGSSVTRYFKGREAEGKAVSEQERRELGRHVMVLAFEHIASRVVLWLDSLASNERLAIKSLVVSGGVAANQFLRHLLGRYLQERGYPGIKLVVPPQKYCTDNAAMIAWAGLEMYRAGWKTGLRALPSRKWSLDDGEYAEGSNSTNEHGTGGVLGIPHWERHTHSVGKIDQ